MEKRTTQWIKGFEFLDQRKEDIAVKIAALEHYFNKPLPSSIKEYLKKHKPIDIFDYSSFSDDVLFEMSNMVFSGKNFWGISLSVGFLYDIDEILSRIESYENSSLGAIHARLGIMPIANLVSPDGDVVTSLRQDYEGCIFYLTDYQMSKVGEETLIANNIHDFISHVEIMPITESMRQQFG